MLGVMVGVRVLRVGCWVLGGWDGNGDCNEGGERVLT